MSHDTVEIEIHRQQDITPAIAEMQAFGFYLVGKRGPVLRFERRHLCECGNTTARDTGSGRRVCDRCRRLEGERDRQSNREEERRARQQQERFLLDACIEFNAKAEAWLRKRGG